jgi:hypothetical protein
MPFLSNLSDIRLGETGHIFEGFEFGDVNVSFFFTDAKLGQGPALHYHPYEVVFVILDGRPHSTSMAKPLAPTKAISCSPLPTPTANLSIPARAGFPPLTSILATALST